MVMEDVVQTGQVFDVRASGWIEYGGLHPKMRHELGRNGTGIELEGDEEGSLAVMVRRWLLLFC